MTFVDSAVWWSSYRQWLSSPGWLRDKRLAVLARDQGQCRVCGAAADIVHHVDYTRAPGSEWLSDLVSVCSADHAALHARA